MGWAWGSKDAKFQAMELVDNFTWGTLRSLFV